MYSIPCDYSYILSILNSEILIFWKLTDFCWFYKRKTWKSANFGIFNNNNCHKSTLFQVVKNSELKTVSLYQDALVQISAKSDKNCDSQYVLSKISYISDFFYFRHFSAIFDNIRHYLTIFGIFWQFLEILQYSTSFIIQQFDIFLPSNMSKNVAVHDFYCRIMLRTL